MTTIQIYKITKIVRALWLAERSCMRVCINMVVALRCFSFRANHASTNLKKFSSSKLEKFTLFINSSVGENLENHYKEGVSIFFGLSWQFKREKSVFWIASFCKTRTDYACKTPCTRLCDWYRLQNSPYFCVFKFARAVKQKVWNEAENRERDWGETLKIRTVRFAYVIFVRITRFSQPRAIPIG